MTKAELITKVLEKESQRISGLSDQGFFLEYVEWFMLTAEEAEKDRKKGDYPNMKRAYLEDYANWKQDNSEEELKELV